MSAQAHGVTVLAVLFFACALILVMSFVLSSALHAAARRRELRLQPGQVELARRAHTRVVAERRQPAATSAPVDVRPAATPRLRRVS